MSIMLLSEQSTRFLSPLWQLQGIQVPLVLSTTVLSEAALLIVDSHYLDYNHSTEKLYQHFQSKTLSSKQALIVSEQDGNSYSRKTTLLSFLRFSDIAIMHEANLFALTGEEESLLATKKLMASSKMSQLYLKGAGWFLIEKGRSDNRKEIQLPNLAKLIDLIYKIHCT